MRIFTEEEEAGTVPLPPSYSIDRFLLEDLISSICLTYCKNRRDTVLALIHHIDRLLQLSAPHVTVEVLMGHILQLPSAPNIPIFYGSVLSGLCKQKPTVFPVILNKAVNRLFMRLTSMHPVSINRFALWFGQHLSNWKYEWKWEDWSMALQLPQDSPKVRFIREVLAKCLRLSYYEHVMEVIPRSFHPFLPPQPATNFKYGKKPEAPSSEMTLSSKLNDAISSKTSPSDIVAILDELDQLSPDLTPQELEVRKVEIVMHTLLEFGDKSITHCFQTLFKHRPLLLEIIKSSDSKVMCVKAVAEFFQDKSQWLQLVLNKLLRMKVVDPVDVVSFIFLPEAVGALTRGLLWDMIDSTMQITIGIFEKASQEMKKCQVELARYSDFEVLTVNDEEKRSDLESEVKLHTAKMEEADSSLKDTVILLTKKFLQALSQHFRVCTERNQNPQNQWFICTLAGLQQILLQHRLMIVRYSAELESQVFVEDLHPSFLDIYKRYQHLV
jgi:nuclear cap-binding protein subunit 1